ncbi:hypothetical protein FPQ18DRAFT_393679 [Pyronema domesticum]|uniref:Uncharacterized protein n=1 Tax=Pyronema omphalodes (strain CBS 100304) TaxID=1076935 RepID=U4LNC8_PYROM|nr:hypothetical protein FPQ18DRAFT_393679 [Pyronema domesticum]CCX15890.1 Protein of unknown function [Pyronema omphalodes CBS 100304]
MASSPIPKSGNLLRTPVGPRYHDGRQGSSQTIRTELSLIGGLSPSRGSFDDDIFYTPREHRYSGSEYPPGQVPAVLPPPRSRFTKHVDAANTYKCNIDDDASPPRVRASAIRKSETMTAAGQSMFPRLDNTEHSPPKSATQTTRPVTLVSQILRWK